MGIKGKIIGGIVTIVIFLVIGLIIGFVFGGVGLFVTSAIDITQAEAEIFQGINQQRVSIGLPALDNDTALITISNGWSNQLALMDTLTHGDFNGRMSSIGLPDTQFSTGEIIGSFQSGSMNGIPDTSSASDLAKEFVDMWLNSPPHKKIMFTASSGYMGVGLSRNGSTFYGVVDFKFAGDIQSSSQPDTSGTYTITVPMLPTPNTITLPTPSVTPSQNYNWSSYTVALRAGSQYVITVIGNQGYSFDSYRYVTSTHVASTEINDVQSTLSVSGDAMTLNVYFVADQTNQKPSASITIVPTSNIQLDLEVRDGTAIVNSSP